ncbi:Lrp/AsnC family transcriptional regulator [Methanoregula sp.]|uniref:Lrp/AsnC family transcriptional regulator n=1 Tax=Methanoregula sp. TaxID=2052170 RepID=UPI000CBB87E4|nr:AsnC family transcriptional regulator [Methanoregula sp.]PKG32260.1 MAG: Lrp/AsnC family transcriptional regulator [Methanoregula sp.]
MKEGLPVDRTDLALLECLQDDLPLVPRPWQVIAEKLGITEDVLLERLRRLTEAGIVRGISPVLESRPLGLSAATLVAFQVPEDRIDEVAAVVSSCPEVSHNFRREDPINLWFTITAKDRAAVDRVLKRILETSGVPETDVLDLPTVRRVKIDVRFRFSRPEGEDV